MLFCGLNLQNANGSLLKVKFGASYYREFLSYAFNKQAISAHKQTLCQLFVLSFRVEVTEEKDM